MAMRLPVNLHLDLANACSEIKDLIHSTLKRLNRDGAVVALSGGLDSAVTATLTVRALGANRVHLVNMPERDSNPIHRKHAKLMANHLGIALQKKSLTGSLRAIGTYRLLPLGLVPGRNLRSRLVQFARKKMLPNRSKELLADRLQPDANSWIARGNAYAISKHRLRLVYVYQYADIHKLMVVGAANRTEWLTGTFSKWGVDHCADVMPLMHVYRSQLEEIANHIGVPDYIRNKPADPDLMPGIDNKGFLLGDFVLVDQILVDLENDVDIESIADTYGKENVKRVQTLYKLSSHMRASPYHLNKSNH